MTLYRNILKQAWQIAWRCKYLWFFGFFASLLGNGYEYDLLFNSVNGDIGANAFPGLQKIAETGFFSWHTLANMGKMMSENPLSVLSIILIGFLVLVLLAYLVWLAVISQIAIVNDSAAIIAKKDIQKNVIQNGITAGMKSFWPVFGFNALIKIVGLFIFTLISLPILFISGKIGVNLVYAIVFLILVPAVIILSFIIKYAIAYVVIRGNGIVEALEQGWQLFARNWLVSLEMAFVLFFTNLFVGIALSLTILVLAIPLVLLAYLSLKFISIVAFWAVAVFAFIIIMALIITTGAMLAIFQISSWTGLFIELVGKGATSKLIRWAGKIMDRTN